MAATSTKVGDVLKSLGGIPTHRVILHPAPGTATEHDLYDLHERTNRPYELVDGTIVEKASGFDESRMAMELAGALHDHVETHDLGRVWGCNVLTRLSPGLVQLPNVAFIS